MKKKWTIVIIVPILFGIAYYTTYEIAKKLYYDSIQEKINGVKIDRFHDALSISSSFLDYSSNAVISRSNSIKVIAREVGFDRYHFSILWRRYINSAETLEENIALFNLDFFTVSNVYNSLTRSGKQNKDIATSIIRLTRASRDIQNIENIIEMDSIIHIADHAEQAAYECQDAIRVYADYSHDINDWKHFDSIEYSKKINKYLKLKEEPFSLYDYFFNNPLDKDE